MTKIKELVAYILFPLSILLGTIYYLLGKTKRLEGEIARGEGRKELEKVLSELEKSGGTADDKEAEFNTAYSDYIQAKRDSGLSD